MATRASTWCCDNIPARRVPSDIWQQFVDGILASWTDPATGYTYHREYDVTYTYRSRWGENLNCPAENPGPWSGFTQTDRLTANGGRCEWRDLVNSMSSITHNPNECAWEWTALATHPSFKFRGPVHGNYPDTDIICLDGFEDHFIDIDVVPVTP